MEYGNMKIRITQIRKCDVEYASLPVQTPAVHVGCDRRPPLSRLGMHPQRAAMLQRALPSDPLSTPLPLSHTVRPSMCRERQGRHGVRRRLQL